MADTPKAPKVHIDASSAEVYETTSPSRVSAAHDDRRRVKAQVDVMDDASVSVSQQRVDSEDVHQTAAEPQVAASTVQADTTRTDTADTSHTVGASTAFSAWLTYHFPGHEHAIIGAACGLLVALLVFAIGFFQTLFIVVLVAGGAAIGQFFDGDPRIISIIRQIVSERRG